MLAGIGTVLSRSESASIGASDLDPESSHSIESAIFAIVLLLLAPLLVASRNDPYPLYLTAGSWLTLFALAGVVYMALVAAQMMATALRFGSSFRMLIQLGCYFVVLSGFAFPLAHHTGLVEPEDAGVNATSLMICILASAAVLIAAQRWRYLVRFGLVAYVAANVVVIAYAFATDTSVDATQGLPVSSVRNIFVLSFDGLSGSATKEALTSDHALSEELEGFVVFDSVASSSPGTSASIAAELSGNTNFKEFAETTAELWDSAPQDLLTNVLIDHGYRVTTYSVYGRSLDKKGIRIRSATLPQSTALEVMDLALARTLTPLVVRGPIAAAVEKSLEAVQHSDSSSRVQQIRQSLSPSWDKNLTMSVTDFEAMVDGLWVGQDQPAAFFLHFTHTHYPVEWSSSCDFLGDDQVWFSEHQNHSGVVGESTCALRQLSRFLHRLKSLGVLENSLVVLKSDHGKPVSYAPENTIESVTINDHELWGLSRYAPFLAVRQGDAARELTLDSSAVMLDDLARTICQEAEIDYDCTRYPGYNILRESHLIDPTAQVTAFVVRSAESDYRFDEHQALTFTRGDNVLLSMYDALLATGMVHETPTEVLSSP